MGWSIGFDNSWNRDIGYGVPAYCDSPDCWAEINRGLSYVCGGDPFGGERGCGLFFCSHHLFYTARGVPLCRRCLRNREPYEAKPDHQDWNQHKLAHESWKQWREENPTEVEKLRAA